MNLIAAVLLLASAAQRLPEDPADLRTTAIRPVALSEALSRFERICLATAFDPARFEAALARSGWRFRPGTSSAPTLIVRTAPQGAFMLNPPPVPGERAFGPSQCNFEAVARPAPSEAALEAAIEAALSRSLGSTPPLLAFSNERCWRWVPAAGTVHRLCRMQRPGLVAGQIVLSFQQWTAEMEARAGLAPGSRR